MSESVKLTKAARRDLLDLVCQYPVDLRYGPYSQLVAAGYVRGPQDRPEVTPQGYTAALAIEARS